MREESDETRPSKNVGHWLLLSLFLSLLVLPLFEGLHIGKGLVIAGFSLTVIIAVLSTRSELRLAGFALMSIALPASWATVFVDSVPLHLLHCLVGCALYWTTGILIVLRVIKNHVISIDSVFNAISAYLLFGLAWALSYSALFIIEPASFPIAELRDSVDLQAASSIDFSQFIYYSFVTMSTLGYGDIAPEGRVARTLSWMQSVTGQFYVAVLIAWLVSALPRPREQIVENVSISASVGSQEAGHEE